MTLRKRLQRDIDNLLNDDEISPEEAAFLIGYNED